MWWKPEIFKEKQPLLERRMKLLRAVRGWFDGQGFYEVETPVLQACPVMDAHIHAFATDVMGVDLKYERTLYLHTSPEFAMKKLMVAGLPKLYQICHVFRNGEGSRLHSPEFTMLEWYRAPGDYRDIMQDCRDLLRHCAESLEIARYSHRGRACDPFAPWQVMTVTEAFRVYAGLDLESFLPPADGRGAGKEKEFAAAVKGIGLHTAEDDRWDDLFFRVMGERIEPHLGMDVPAILHDYPAPLASLSRRRADDPRLAERFEMYVCGIELANAFSELTDAAEQKKRFAAETEIRKKLYGETYPADPDFFAALAHGLPESGGIALGIDRLAMLAAGADDISQVLWTGRP